MSILVLEAYMAKTSSTTSPHARLRFVTITNWNERSDAKIHRMIRSQATRDFRRKTKKSKPNPEDRYLTILPLPHTDAARTGPDELFTNHSVNTNGEAPHCEQDGLDSEADFLVAVVMPMPLKLLGCYIWHLETIKTDKAGSPPGRFLEQSVTGMMQ